MAIHYRLLQNNIKSNKAYGKWYAHTVKQGELTLKEIERQIQERCSLTSADVRAAIAALTEVVEEGLKKGLFFRKEDGEPRGVGKIRLEYQESVCGRPQGLPCRHARQGDCMQIHS